MSPVNTKLELELKFVSWVKPWYAGYVMCTFCHWYKNSGTDMLFFIVKLQTAEENSKKCLFWAFTERSMNLLCSSTKAFDPVHCLQKSSPHILGYFSSTNSSLPHTSDHFEKFFWEFLVQLWHFQLYRMQSCKTNTRNILPWKTCETKIP